MYFCTKYSHAQDQIDITDVMDYLVIELRSDPHVQLHIQLIVVSNKWTSHCSTGNNVHHWRLNLK